MLRIEIESRPIIPVRLIPFVTGWQFSPDVTASILACDAEIDRVFIPSFRLSADGKHHLMLAKEWGAFCADLDALSKTLDATETVDNQNYATWRRESIKTLPPATFVWLEELEAAWRSAYSEERMSIIGEGSGDRELNLTPLIPSDVAELVYEGFKSLLIPVTAGNGAQTTNIRFEELHYFVMLDPFYGVESAATESIINSIYRDNLVNPPFQRFSRRFSLLPCKTDKQRHLIYLWCGLMGLPAYRNNQPLGWQREEFLDHWTEDFDLRLDEVKEFLRKHSWPLPTWSYPDEVDNTERKIALDEAEFEAAFHDISVVLPQLEADLAEVKAIQPESMVALQQKREEVNELERRITAIKNGHHSNDNETSAERKKRLEDWYKEEERNCKRGALQRTAQREGIARQTLSNILRR